MNSRFSPAEVQNGRGTEYRQRETIFIDRPTSCNNCYDKNLQLVLHHQCKVLEHRTTQRINGDSINSMGSNAVPTLVHKRWNSSDTENSRTTLLLE